MNTPAKPEDPPATPAEPAPQGVPDGMSDHETKGYPHSDRQKAETASQPEPPKKHTPA